MSDETEDIVADLRECAAESRALEGDYYADQFATGPEIFERAADEIERLRLTGEEREAVRFFSLIDGPGNVPVANKRAATLRSLLERHGPTAPQKQIRAKFSYEEQ